MLSYSFQLRQLGKTIKNKKGQHATGSLAQAEMLPRGTPRRILEVHLPSKPYRYPRLPQAVKTLYAAHFLFSANKKLSK